LFRAFVEGLGRVRRAPALIAGLWLATFVVALPLALTLRGTMASHLGSSVAADTAVSGVNYDWWNEFLAQTAGLGQTFVPSIIGFAAVLKNFSVLADAEGLPIVIACAVAAYAIVSLFLTGGILDRLARNRRTGSHGFFSACGMYFFRLSRLISLAALVYYVLFTQVHRELFGRLYPAITRDVTVERTALLYRVLLYVFFAGIVVVVNVWFDYAKIRMIVEDRRSVIGALAAALRFVGRNVGAVFGLYCLDMVLFFVVLALYAILASGASGGLAAAVIGFVVAQLYIALRVAVRLVFAASEIAFFQSRLAHAGYVIGPAPAWPDSPAAEAIRPDSASTR
jgi:hypothetical protein